MHKRLVLARRVNDGQELVWCDGQRWRDLVQFSIELTEVRTYVALNIVMPHDLAPVQLRQGKQVVLLAVPHDVSAGAGGAVTTIAPREGQNQDAIFNVHVGILCHGNVRRIGLEHFADLQTHTMCRSLRCRNALLAPQQHTYPRRRHDGHEVPVVLVVIAIH